MVSWIQGNNYEVLFSKYKVFGIYRRTGPVTVEITEIPVGSEKESYSFRKYKNFVENLIVDDKERDEKIRAKQILKMPKTLIDGSIN